MKRIILQIRTNFQVTYVILAVNMLIWIIMELVGGSTNGIVLLRFGALYKNYVFSGEIWRMVSCAFLHIGILHLIVNSYTLLQLGNFVEKFFGPKKLIATYVLTAITSSLLSLAFSDSISAGASGALFGLTGLLLGNAWAKKAYTFELPIDEYQLIPFVIFNLYIGFMIPQIDNWAHIGGLIGGIVLGYILDPALSFDPSSFKRIAPEVLGKLSLLVLIVSAIFWIANILSINII